MRKDSTQYNKWLTLIFVSFGIWIFYTLTNQLTFYEGAGGPSLDVDQKIPLIPVSIWIYTFYYLIVVVSWHLMADGAMRQRFLWWLLVVNIVSNAIFILFPTSYPRPGLPENCDWILGSCYLFQLIHFFDTPANCFPSLHVSMSWLAAAIWWKGNRRYFCMLGFWALLISASTLTTRQHFLMDVLAGAALAAMVSGADHFVKGLVLSRVERAGKK